MRPFFLFFVLPIISARKQYANVKGTLYCEGDTVENAKVELWEHDIFTPNDLLNSVTTDILGEFEVRGSDNEYMDIAPYLVIRHFCNARPNCPRETTINILPSENKDEVISLSQIDLTFLRLDENDSCFKNRTSKA